MAAELGHGVGQSWRKIARRPDGRKQKRRLPWRITMRWGSGVLFDHDT
jgi:hypothetical protein